VSAATVGSAARRSRTRAAALAANRDFRLLWIGQMTSELGSSMSGVAMPLLALAVTGSAALAGGLATVAFAAMWLSALPGGYVADRYDGRRVMVLCDAIRALMLAVVAASVVAGFVSIWLLAAAAAVVGTSDMLFAPTAARAVRAIVRREEVPEAVAVSQARSYAADLVGPSAGGLLFALGRACPFVFDAVSFCVSLACTLRLRTGLKPSQPAAGRLRFFPSIAEGWAHVRRDPFLRASTLYSAVMNVAASTLMFVLILGVGSSSGGAVTVGVALSLAAGAGLAGSAAAPVIQRRFGLRTVLIGVAAVRAVSVLGAAMIGGSVALAFAVASVVLLSPVVGAAIAAARMLLVPEELFGRVSGTSSFIASAAQPAAPLLAGVLLQALSLHLALVVLAAAFGAVTLASLIVRGLDADLRRLAG
jgi:hypothetical protein